jgi:hypothetical protein
MWIVQTPHRVRDPLLEVVQLTSVFVRTLVPRLGVRLPMSNVSDRLVVDRRPLLILVMAPVICPGSESSRNANDDHEQQRQNPSSSSFPLRLGISRRRRDVTRRREPKLCSVEVAYGQAQDPWNSWVLPVLREMPVPVLMEGSSLDRRTVQRLRSGQARPHRGNELILTRLAGQWARRQLFATGRTTPREDHLACRAWLERPY